MRTPLNSIISQNLGTHFNHKQMKRIIYDIGRVAAEAKMKKLSSLVKCLEEVTHQLDLGLQIQDSSSKIMKSLVGDILDFAQLQNGKFRKDEQFFNIRKTIKEVISILEY